MIVDAAIYLHANRGCRWCCCCHCNYYYSKNSITQPLCEIRILQYGWIHVAYFHEIYHFVSSFPTQIKNCDQRPFSAVFFYFVVMVEVNWIPWILSEQYSWCIKYSCMNKKLNQMRMRPERKKKLNQKFHIKIENIFHSGVELWYQLFINAITCFSSCSIFILFIHSSKYTMVYGEWHTEILKSKNSKWSG